MALRNGLRGCCGSTLKIYIDLAAREISPVPAKKAHGKAWAFWFYEAKRPYEV